MQPNILIIDDSPEIHQLLAVRLRSEELTLHHALLAAEGVAKAQVINPDLILLDIDLPDLTGLEVCQRLKDDPRTFHVPIIFLTAAGHVMTKVAGFTLGAVDYVTKPFEPAELCARVRAVLRTKRYQDMLAIRAQVDALTGLWNRSYFDRRLAEEVSAGRRYGRLLSLALVDIDHFKDCNDTFGHPFGDRVLQKVGEALATSLRATDAACRYGGEEFALILTETGHDGAVVACRRVLHAVSHLGLECDGSAVSISCSIGLTSNDQQRDPRLTDGQQLIRQADRALYAAKRNGRNRIEMAGSDPPRPAPGAPSTAAPPTSPGPAGATCGEADAVSGGGR